LPLDAVYSKRRHVPAFDGMTTKIKPGPTEQLPGFG